VTAGAMTTLAIYIPTTLGVAGYSVRCQLYCEKIRSGQSANMITNIFHVKSLKAIL